MKIEKVQIQGVGTLQDKTIEFAREGVTLLLGANERGKSTLCRALIATIYGFRLPVRWEELRPKGQDLNSKGRIEFTTDSGRLIITREFENNETRVTQLANGAEKNLFEGPANPRGRTEVVDTYRSLLSETLGFPSYDTWQSSSYIGQLAVEIKLDRELRKLISGAGQADYKSTLDSIRNQYYDLTRVPLRGDNKRAGDKSIERLENEIEELSTQFLEAKRAQSEIAAQHADRETHDSEFKAIADEIKDLSAHIQGLTDFLQQSKRYRELQSQEELQTGMERRLSLLAGEIDAHKEQLAAERFSGLNALTPEGLSALKRYVNSDAEQVLARLKTMEAEETRLQGELSAPGFSSFTSATEDTGTRLIELKDLEDRKQEVVKQLAIARARADTPTSRTIWLIPLALFLLAGVVGALIGGSLASEIPFSTAVTILAGGLLLAFPSGLLGIFITLWLQRRPQTKAPEVIAAETRLDQVETAIHLSRELLNISINLDQQDVSLDVLIERWDRYSEYKNRLVEIRGNRKLLEEQETLKLRERADLAPLLAKDSSAVLNERIVEFERLKTQLVAKSESLSDLQRQETSGSSTETSRERKDTLTRIDAIMDRWPSFLAYKEDSVAGNRLLGEKRQELNLLETRRNRIATEIQTMRENTARHEGTLKHDPVILAEILEDKRIRLDRLRLQTAALRTAYEILSEVTYEYEETYFDLMAERASDYFRLFTKGAYISCHIGSAETITVDHISGQVFLQNQLSSGTLDQLYLAVRLAISDTIGSVEKMPILLDDTFVNFDRDRLKAAIEVIQEITKKRQVIMLTHEDRFNEFGFTVIHL